MEPVVCTEINKGCFCINKLRNNCCKFTKLYFWIFCNSFIEIKRATHRLVSIRWLRTPVPARFFALLASLFGNPGADRSLRYYVEVCCLDCGLRPASVGNQSNLIVFVTGETSALLVFIAWKSFYTPKVGGAVRGAVLLPLDPRTSTA